MRRFTQSSRSCSCLLAAVSSCCQGLFPHSSKRTFITASVPRLAISQGFKTPSFGDVAPTDSKAAAEQLENVRLESVSGMSPGALHGPWVCVMPQGIDVPSGEIMLQPDGTAFFRPGSELGSGVGRFSVTHDGMFSLELEVYLYGQKSQQPPNDPLKLSVTAMIQQAVIGSHNNAKILTLQGRVSVPSAGGAGGEIQAAKMDNWSPETQTPKPWAPKADVQRELANILPPLKNFARRPKLDLEKHRVGSIDKLYYVPNWVSEAEEAEMLQVLQNTPDVAKSKLTKRVAQEWGCTMCDVCNLSFVSEGNMPPWCDQVGDGLMHSGIFTPSIYPNNVRIHEYNVGEGIGPHVDGPIYVPRVAIMSLASPCLMSFYPRRDPYENPMDHYDDTFKFDGEIARQTPCCSLVLEPRSLFVFSHDAYWFYPHGVSDKAVDSLKEEDVGPIINRHLLTTIDSNATSLERKYRVGVTVRHLLPRCTHQPTRSEYFMKRASDMLNPSQKQPQQATPSSRMSSSPTSTAKVTPAPPPPPSPPRAKGVSSGLQFPKTRAEVETAKRAPQTNYKATPPQQQQQQQQQECTMPPYQQQQQQQQFFPQQQYQQQQQPQPMMMMMPQQPQQQPQQQQQPFAAVMMASQQQQQQGFYYVMAQK
eukprot:PhM_4_TR18610/c5_g1_i3/m.83787/K10768/ALKBH6; alkylated DNA repair protein alkB homolog 6